MAFAKNQYATQYGLQTDTPNINAPTYFTEAYFAGMDDLDPNTAASRYNGLVPMVLLYKINWDQYNADMAAASP
jgi:hypothetical protein